MTYSNTFLLVLSSFQIETESFQTNRSMLKKIHWKMRSESLKIVIQQSKSSQKLDMVDFIQCNKLT